MSAKEAMRTILKKSGSESDSLDPTLTDLQDDGFNLYSSINSDPLLNLDILKLSEPAGVSQDKSKVNTKSRQKAPLTRSASESAVSKDLKESPGLEIMDHIIHEADDDVLLDMASEKKEATETLEKKSNVESSRSIFSDSETVDAKSPSSSGARARKMKHTHKRSRSDISGIKTSAVEKEVLNGNGEKPKIAENSGKSLRLDLTSVFSIQRAMAMNSQNRPNLRDG